MRRFEGDASPAGAVALRDRDGSIGTANPSASTFAGFGNVHAFAFSASVDDALATVAMSDVGPQLSLLGVSSDESMEPCDSVETCEKTEHDSAETAADEIEMPDIAEASDEDDSAESADPVDERDEGRRY